MARHDENRIAILEDQIVQLHAALRQRNRDDIKHAAALKPRRERNTLLELNIGTSNRSNMSADTPLLSYFTDDDTTILLVPVVINAKPIKGREYEVSRYHYGRPVLHPVTGRPIKDKRRDLVVGRTIIDQHVLEIPGHEHTSIKGMCTISIGQPMETVIDRLDGAPDSLERIATIKAALEKSPTTRTTAHASLDAGEDDADEPAFIPSHQVDTPADRFHQNP